MPTLNTLNDVVEDYIFAWRDRQGRDGRWFAAQPSLDAAIRHAAMAEIPSEKHPDRLKRQNHQRRIPRAALQAWTTALLRRKRKIAAARTFSDLYEVLGETAADLHGIGALAIYDTATRIGAFLRLKPQHVYLHAGTRDGAKALGLGRGERLRRSELPAAFHRLSPSDIEDCLCIYKRQIRAVARRGAAAAPRGRGCTLTVAC